MTTDYLIALTPHQAAIVAAYVARQITGESCTSIARRFGCSQSYVSILACRAGVTFRPLHRRYREEAE